MTAYTITYSDAEELAMSYAAISTDEWLQNVAHDRARVAMDDIVNIAVQKYLAAGQSIPGSKDDIVKAAFDNGWVLTAAQRLAALDAKG